MKRPTPKRSEWQPPEPPEGEPEDVAQPLRRVATDTNYDLDFIQRAPHGIVDPEGWRLMQIRIGYGARLRRFDRDVRIRRAMLRRSGCARKRGCNRDVATDGVHECESFCSDLSEREFKTAVGWCLRQLARLENRLDCLDSRY